MLQGAYQIPTCIKDRNKEAEPNFPYAAFLRNDGDARLEKMNFRPVIEGDFSSLS